MSSCFLCLFSHHNLLTSVLNAVVSESQQGFKSYRPPPEETVRAGVFAAADVSEHAPQTLQQERKGDVRLLLLLILTKLSEGTSG